MLDGNEKQCSLCVFLKGNSLGFTAWLPQALSANITTVPTLTVSTSPTGNRFGTFGGVFTPCTLTILGVIMFLRFGQVVGEAGIFHALVIVGMAKLITTLTALSLAAIATNTRVKGGGAYYLISRSLGIEFGGAIGVVFYLSQAVSVAMYVIGFTEAVVAIIPSLAEHTRWVATVVNLIVFACVYIGAGWTIKMQYGILAVLLLSICAFVGGAVMHWDPLLIEANWNPAYGAGASIWTAFALFFPAATGIMAGANMSGDLADPGRSIPKGTLFSIAFTAMIYAGFALLLGASADRSLLLGDTMIVSHLSLSSSLIMAGIFAATLSSALGSMMGAPRILQALAKDRPFKSLAPFARLEGQNKEPRRATILTLLIAQGGILLGDLNAIAPVITMFFMITYGGLNWATFTEAFSRNPSYRPTFRWCHWTFSLLGALLCTGAMILIDWRWAIASALVMGALYKYLARKEMDVSWGDANGGAALERARRNLLILEQERYHPKNWRPSVLAFGATRVDREHLATYGRWLAGSHGLLMLGQVVIGEPEDHLERHAEALRLMRKMSLEDELEAFPAAIIAESFDSGVASMIQCSGIGALRPNLALFGWSLDPKRRAAFLGGLRSAARLGKSVAVLRCEPPPEDPWEVPEGSIDVWWLGQGNGELMLLLAHLLRSNSGWRSRTVRLMRMLPREAGLEETRLHLDELSRSSRIPAVSRVLVGTDFKDALHRESDNAALVVLGLPDPREMTTDYLTGFDRLLDQLPRVLLVHSAGDMSLHE